MRSTTDCAYRLSAPLPWLPLVYMYRTILASNLRNCHITYPPQNLCNGCVYYPILGKDVIMECGGLCRLACRVYLLVRLHIGMGAKNTGEGGWLERIKLFRWKTTQKPAVEFRLGLPPLRGILYLSGGRVHSWAAVSFLVNDSLKRAQCSPCILVDLVVHCQVICRRFNRQDTLPRYY